MLRVDPRNLWMLKAFIIVNIVDAITTVRALSYGGSEGNILLSTGFDSIGIGGTLVLKVVASIVVGIVLVKYNKGHLLKWPTLVILLIAIFNSLQTYFY